MNPWLHNPMFPGLLYTKATNIEEYYKAIIELLNPITITKNHYGVIFEETVYPLDNSEWADLFLCDTAIFGHSCINDLKLKPTQDEFPILIHFSSNHKYFFWTSLNDVQ